MKGMYVESHNTNTSSGYTDTYGAYIKSTSDNTGPVNNFSVLAECYGEHTRNIAGQFQSVQNNDYSNVGLVALGSNSISNTGVLAEANTADPSAVLARGIIGKASGAATTIGVIGEAFEETDGVLIGVRAEAFNNPAHTGTNTWYGVLGVAPLQSCTTGTCAGAAGFFNGDVYSSNGVYSSSDLKLSFFVVIMLFNKNIVISSKLIKFSFSGFFLI